VVALFITFRRWQGLWPSDSPFALTPEGVKTISVIYPLSFVSLFGCLMAAVLLCIFPSLFPNSFCLSAISLCPWFSQSQDCENLYVTVLWSCCSRCHQTLPPLSLFHHFFWCFHSLTFLFIFHSYKPCNLISTTTCFHKGPILRLWTTLIRSRPSSSYLQSQIKEKLISFNAPMGFEPTKSSAYFQLHKLESFVAFFLKFTWQNNSERKSAGVTKFSPTQTRLQFPALGWCVL